MCCTHKKSLAEKHDAISEVVEFLNVCLLFEMQSILSQGMGRNSRRRPERMLPQGQGDGAQPADPTNTHLGELYSVQHCRQRQLHGLHGTFLLSDETQQDMEGTNGAVHIDVEGWLVLLLYSFREKVLLSGNRKDLLLFFQIFLNLVFFLLILPLIKFSPGERKEIKWAEEEQKQLRHKSNNNQVNKEVQTNAGPAGRS